MAAFIVASNRCPKRRPLHPPKQVLELLVKVERHPRLHFEATGLIILPN
jgi:hypothetical protein